MKKNEGRVDRWIRIVVGVALLGVGFAQAGGAWAVILPIVGLVALGTGFFGWCPAYSVLGISTCPRE